MFLNFIKNVFGSRNDRVLKKYTVILFKINLLENDLIKLNDLELKEKFLQLKDNSKKYSLDELLILVFAIVREVAKRTLHMRHFDVQILSGISLYDEKISEVSTGEGKTLIATLPACLYFLINKSVHVVTVNDYLAKRDAVWMGPVYSFLGISVGINTSDISFDDKKSAYRSNIVYGTSSEFGFDYLRDNIVLSKNEKVQNDLFYVLIDEVDSILIDEARTPLIISIPDKVDKNLYNFVDRLVKNLFFLNDNNFKNDLTIDEKGKQVYLTESGFNQVELYLKKYNLLNNNVSLYDPKNIELLYTVYASLKVHYFFKKDIDYIIKKSEVLIVDENTGRVMDGRRWGDGIHQAIEAKEKLIIKGNNQTLASISFQNYFRLYKKISGMTGTAITEAIEFESIYNLDVVVIPTNSLCIRVDQSDVIFLTKKAKFKAVVLDIKKSFECGRPILVGTASINISEFLSRLLKDVGIKHNVLNAKYHDTESKIISEAGGLFSVTISTNMAGRGTDIVLGGFDKQSKQYIDNYNKVITLGGLRVIGIERHESRRIDNQLRGRSGRQGDPGSTQFYLSLEDDLIRIFVGDKTMFILNKFKTSDSEIISHKLITSSIENAQKKIEANNFDIRKQLLEYDDIINEQRIVFYNYRNVVIFSDDIINLIKELLFDVVAVFVSDFIDRDVKCVNIVESFNLKFGFKISIEDYKTNDSIFFNKLFFDRLLQSYLDKINNKNILYINDFQKSLLINILDLKWKDHLINLDYLKSGIHLRGYGQKDPKIEYKREAFVLFFDMLSAIKMEFVSCFFKFVFDNTIDLDKKSVDFSSLNFEHKKNNIALNNNEMIKKRPFIRNDLKIGRNELCFCKSGKKYKYCHGK